MHSRLRSTRPDTLAGLGLSVLLVLSSCSEPGIPTGPDQRSLPTVNLGVQQASGSIIPDQYIVQFHDDVNDVPGLAKQLVAQSRGQLHFTYTSVLKGFSAQLPAQAVVALQHNPMIRLIEPDFVVTADTTTQSGATWGLDRIDQRLIPLNSTYIYQETGAGVTVYIIDTGIRYTHTEFGGRASFGFDAFGGTGADCHGHGTHVAGTVGGAKYGVAKGVKLVAVRVLDCNGSGSGSGVIAGLDWVTKNGPRPGVANMSLGGGASSSLDNAVDNLFKAGIVTAVAAGNSNVDACTVSPARAPNAMTVGASDNKDARASFSNYGSCVDWFAPGVGIASAMSSSDIATATMSGTSMAAPHTAGAAALYLQKNPDATPQQVRDGLLAQSTKSKVTSAASMNNHLLYALANQDNSWTPPPPGPPVASFSQLCIDLSCTFTDQSSSASSTITTWAWDFGDGAKATGQKVTHAYAAAGSYSVALTVTDDAKASATTTANITVAVSKIIVIAKASKIKGGNRVDLTWTGATTPSVEIYRNSQKLITVANTGKYTDSSPGKGSLAGYTYRVCELGLAYCSQATYLTP